MRIWYDACTGKHVRYGAAITKRLEEKGHEIIFTTRKHPDTLPLARHLNLKVEVIGKYDPRTSYTRLYEGLKRQLKFSKIFMEDPPNYAICHGSVDLCRVAFGLGVPIICTFDTPHADAVNRLTVPLASIVVASKAIPQEIIRSYGAKRIIQFDGVDEVAWMRNFKPLMNFDFKRPLIVVRESEIKAAYAEGIADVTERIARGLTSLGQVIYLSRYSKKRRRELIVPKGFIDSASLAAQADLVVSVGGTIAREAALSGTPSIVIDVFGKIHVNEYLASRGFPIFITKPEDALRDAKKYLGMRFDVKTLLMELENPVDVIENIIEEKY
ncbi:MAG: DUF354 domain-containing protein [Candidatus Bathyarchaeia archaeon]|nr:DUF354 domain-containing protein [Candidatus Bathyarchaeota archaeon]